jgi:hypothetical protein
MRAWWMTGFFLVLRVRLPAKAILVVDGSAYGRRALVGGVDGAALTYLPGILLGKPSIGSSDRAKASCSLLGGFVLDVEPVRETCGP